MSIQNEIIHRHTEGSIFAIVPKAKGAAPRRALFVTEEIWTELNSTHDDFWEKRYGELQAHLDVFASGALIGPKYLSLLYPARDAVWEIRNPESNPSLRVIGLFAQRDVFIATEIIRRDQLDGWQDRGWRELKRRAQAKWRNLFNTYPPLITADVYKVVSGAEVGRYYKDRA